MEEAADQLGESLLDDNQRHSGSSFLQATSNSVSVLLGIAMLSVPHAVEKGGFFGLGILFLFGLIFCYTAYTLGRCLGECRNMSTYPHIAQAAFGWLARITITILLYIEICAVLVGYTISVGDNLQRIFPNAPSLNLFWIKLTPSYLLPTAAILVMLPTVWMRDLSLVSLLSIGGIATYMFIVLAVVWAGVIDGLGFHNSLPLFNLSSISTVSGIYAYCFSGHVVFPNIYSSMKQPSKYGQMLVVSFLIAAGTYTGFALLGATMFGESVKSQITLNIPKELLVGKISLWVVVLSPLTKYALCIAPMAADVEGRFPWPQKSPAHLLASITLRTAIMIIILAVALAFPYFEQMLALIGSALSMSLSGIFPCIFYLKLFWQRIGRIEVAVNFACIMVCVIIGVLGTANSFKSLLLLT